MEDQQISALNVYLERYAFQEQLINTPPDKELGIVVTIPAYNEEEAIHSLESLFKATPPKSSIEILLLLNIPESADDEIIKKSKHQFEILTAFAEKNNKDCLKAYILFKKIPDKHAGVGLARKIIMDEAVRRFTVLDNPEGIITGFDADCLCDSHYFTAIEAFFNDKALNGCSIYFEHPEDENHKPEIVSAALEYELHLRAYINGLRWCGLPHAFQTIGSSMAIRSDAYQKQGGMNKRKAGEDFYFLHKIISQGNFGDLTNTKISPSPRISERVPFGTGKAVINRLGSGAQFSYNPESYIILKKFIDLIPQFFNGALNLPDDHHPLLIDFLDKNDFESNLKRVKKQSTSYHLFQKHFFQWFDGFKTMKFLHFCRENNLKDIEVHEASGKVMELITGDKLSHGHLAWFRNFDKNNPVIYRLDK